MEKTASHTPKIEVLITDVSRYLGASLAQNLLEHDVAVFGVGRQHLPTALLAKKNFTLLSIDLTQPIPKHLPRFDLIFHIVPEDYHSQSPSSSVLSNLLQLCVSGQSKVVLILPVNSNPELIEFLLSREKDLQGFLSFYLIGDIYGPSMDLHQKDTFTQVIAQAVFGNRVILPNDGRDILYPTYISDLVHLLISLILTPGIKSDNSLHIACSSEPQTALDVAYKIQKIAVSLGHDVGLYFSGDPGAASSQAALQLHTHKLMGATSLEEGLQNTLRHFASSSANQPSPATQSHSHVRPLAAQQPVPHEGRFDKLKKIKRPKINVKQRPIPRSKAKIAGIIVALALMLFVGKGIYDVGFGIKEIRSAKTNLEASNWQASQSSSQSAVNHFQKALGKINLLATPLASVLPKQAQSMNSTFQSLIKTAQSLSALARGSQDLSANIAKIAAHSKPSGPEMENMVVSFNTAQENSAQATVYAKQAQEGSLFAKNSKKLLEATQTLNQTAATAYEISNLLSYFTGSTGTRTYLLLMQNNTELRPGGGFIGNVGLIDFQDGQLKSITVEDVYNIDGQLKEKIEPPKPLKEKLGVTQFFLRDSNWSPDFSQNAQLARDFFKKETGKTVDGVISLDLNLMEAILKATGPIKLPEYETITSGNLFDRGEYYSEIGFFPGSTQKKDFFGALARAVIDRILTSLSTKCQLSVVSCQSSVVSGQLSYLKLLQAFNDSLAQKHLMISVDDPILSSFTNTQGFNHPLPPTSYNPNDDATETRDYLAISEANVGANKVNRYIERKIDYDMTIGRDADLVAKLTITYTNKSQAETWPGGKYVNFLRIYVPKGSSLFAYKNGASTDIKQVTGDNYGDLTVMSTYVEVPVKSSKSVTFNYRIPKNIKVEKAPVYNLFVQKQPGTGADPFTFTFHLPNYLEATKLNGASLNSPTKDLTEETTLLTDKQFTVDIKEK